MSEEESFILDNLKTAYRGAFNSAAADTPYVVVMPKPLAIGPFTMLHDYASKAADEAWRAGKGRRTRAFDAGRVLFPQDNTAPLRWMMYSDEELAQEYARAMKDVGVDSAVYRIDTTQEPVLTPVPV